ncbi:hypothetical protein [Dokdonia sp.]|uniref:hypothetical protein n=1 Tax=Dokdonia sp. TaxID=2024995 RepID=UPI0032631501
MEEYYEPDETWEVLGTKTKEAFVAKYVVVGKFHDGVPEDIVKSYVTISHIMAHSYFHYPMYDEAMSKALLVMEMTVKLKAKELNIDLKLPPNRTGTVRDKNLSTLIDEVCAIDELSFLKSDFNRARGLRNSKMHPDRHGFVGVMGHTDANARLFINIINQLFLDTKTLKKFHQKNNQLETALSAFQKSLHVLEFQDQRILIDGFHTFKYREFENNKLLLLYINPLTTKVRELYEEHKYPDPLIITFTDFKIHKERIEGVDLEGKPMKIYIDDKQQNLKTYYDYNMELSKISESDIHMYILASVQGALWDMEKIIYENCKISLI